MVSRLKGPKRMLAFMEQAVLTPVTIVFLFLSGVSAFLNIVIWNTLLGREAPNGLSEENRRALERQQGTTISDDDIISFKRYYKWVVNQYRYAFYGEGQFRPFGMLQG